MGCCVSKKNNNPNQAPPQNVRQPPDPQPNRPAPQNQPIVEVLLDSKFLFKPIPDQSKAYLYNHKQPSVSIVPASLPFKFHRSCTVAYLENEKFFISGGYESDDEMSNQTMLFDLTTLSGTLLPECPFSFVSATAIYFKKKKLVFLIGGLQPKLNDSNISEVFDYKGVDFCVFDLKTRQWDELENPAKNWCLPTCYLNESTIFVCGGFSSITEDSKFNRKTDVFCYNIHTAYWSNASFDYQIPVVGSVALVCDRKILVLGGMSEPSQNSSKVFLLNNNTQLNNLKDFQSPNLAILAPEYINGSKVMFLADPDMLITYDIKQSSVNSESLINMKKTSNEFFASNPTHNPRVSGIYVYLPECGHKVLKDFNVVSQDINSHSFKTIQFRDAGMVVMTDGRLFFAGGVGSSTSKTTALCFVFDAVTGNENEEPNLPSQLRGLRLVEDSGIIYAIAGFNEGMEKEVVGYSYIIASKEWRKLNNIMHPTRYPCCFTLKNYIYAIGGEVIDDEGYENMVDHVQAMDLESKVWTSKVVKYPNQGKCMGSINITPNSVLIFGGEDNDGNSLDTCYLFNGETFEPKPSLPSSCSTYNFESPGVLYNNSGYIFTMAGVLLKVDIDTFEWEELSIEQEFTNRV